MPFAPNNTARVWVRYTSGPFSHELMIRGIQAANAQQVAGIAFRICSAMAPLMSSADSFASARYAAGLSDFSVPIEWSPIEGTGTPAEVPGDPESRYIDWVGRDYTFGARAHWTLFTRSNAVPQAGTNRVYGSDNALIQDVIDQLNSEAQAPIAVDRLVTVSQGQPVIYPYANLGFNSYWQRQQRN